MGMSHDASASQCEICQGVSANAVFFEQRNKLPGAYSESKAVACISRTHSPTRSIVLLSHKKAGASLILKVPSIQLN
jgi:hypothetical protein